MSLLIPGEAKFSMGISPNVVTATTGQEKIDMSLDDLIKSRRQESKGPGLRRSSRRRADPKKPMSTLRQAAQKSNRRVEASRQAKRRAASAHRRGLRDSKSATQMEVEKEVNRATDKPNARGRRNGLKNRALANRRPIKPRPPTKKALKAAVSAMTEAGFTVPDGMKVVINLEKDGSKSATTGKKGTKKLTNGDHPNKNNGGRLWGKKK